MRDPRYWEAGHPERDAHVAVVTRGFQQLYNNESAEGDGRIQVNVRAHSRVVDNRHQHVDAYTQSRQARAPEQPALAQGVPGRQGTEPVPPPAVPRPVVIFVGGLADGSTGIVEGFFDRFGSPDAGHASRYFSHDDGRAIRTFIDSLPQGTRVSLVGHSWGGDTAARVAAALGAAGRKVDTLVTVDPVGRGIGAGFFERVKAGAIHWVNVNAVGTGRTNLPGLIAGLGNDYGSGPQRYADVFLNAPKGHEDFEGMLLAPGRNGLTALDAILGRGEPR